MSMGRTSSFVFLTTAYNRLLLFRLYYLMAADEYPAGLIAVKHTKGTTFFTPWAGIVMPAQGIYPLKFVNCSVLEEALIRS